MLNIFRVIFAKPSLKIKAERNYKVPRSCGRNPRWAGVKVWPFRYNTKGRIHERNHWAAALHWSEKRLLWARHCQKDEKTSCRLGEDTGDRQVWGTAIHQNTQQFLGFSKKTIRLKNGPKAHPFVLDPWVGKIPWRGEWHPLQHSCLGESHGRRSLAGWSPCSHKESDPAEATEHAVGV